MANYITIDGGTTNTRISLVCDLKIIDTQKYNIGARAGITDKSALKNTVRDGISDILVKNNMNRQDISKILASGMITSEFGLYKLDHITAPAGIAELNAAMQEVLLEDISDIPFVFMCGVKTDATELESADMMRGEETELMGLLQDGSGVYILPGSHSKIITVDDCGRITDFFTALTGEMILSLSQNTILKSTVDLNISTLDEEYLIKGFDFCREFGINEALFKARVLDTIFHEKPEALYSFYLGVVLCNEVTRIIKINPPRITIGGKKQIKEALSVILKNKTNADIKCLSDEDVDRCVSLGAVRIYEHKIG